MFFFSLTYEKRLSDAFCVDFPFSGLFCLFLPICLLIKCEIKYTCIATSPWDDPLLFFFLVLKLNGGLNIFIITLKIMARTQLKKIGPPPNLADLSSCILSKPIPLPKELSPST